MNGKVLVYGMLITAALAFGAPAVLAQASETDMLQQLRADIQADRQLLVASNLELTDAEGRPRYDAVTYETTRGCPYKCAFCEWGTGAIGTALATWASSFSLFLVHDLDRYASWIPVTQVATATIGIATVSLYYLTFFPPAAYRRWVAGSARPGAPA